MYIYPHARAHTHAPACVCRTLAPGRSGVRPIDDWWCPTDDGRWQCVCVPLTMLSRCFLCTLSTMVWAAAPVKEEAELFYTPASPELIALRGFIAEYSFPR
jgi:hypothetical protein